MPAKRTTARRTRPREISISFQTFAKAAALAVGLFLLWAIRDVVAVVLVALLLAAVIEPAAARMQAYHIPRAVSVLVIYVILGAAASVVVLALVPVLIDQVASLTANLSAVAARASDSFGALRDAAASYGLEDNLADTAAHVQGTLADGAFSVFSTARGVINGFVAVLAVLVLAFYMVVEERSAKLFFQHIAPKRHQERLAGVVVEMQRKMGGWIRGQAILALLIGTVTYVGLSLIGVRYAFALALIAALCEVVPYIGPVVSAIPAAMIAFADTPLKGALVLAFYFVLQQLEGNLLTPKVMQKAVGLNPIVAIIALLVGVEVGGVAGAVLAIPLATMGVVLLQNLFAQEPYVSS